ncbi:MAG TPA: HEAT repeat domain-containing protein [Anaerolineaceae bacterium]|jgi:HEAT repeat protein
MATNRERTTFQQVLEALLDQNRPFPPVYLNRFSDLDPQNLTALKDVWDSIPVARKRSLLEDLEETAEADTLVSFEDLARHALNDSDAQVRMTAIRLLWEVEDRHLVPVLIHLMEADPDYQVRATAASALGMFVYLGELEEIPEDVHELVENKLLAVTNGDDDPLVRRRALESLGYSSREEVSDLLREAYDRDNVDWLESALYAMGRSADDHWGPAILRMFGHAEATVRAEAVRAAGELELSSARESIMDLLEGETDDDVQMAAIWSLSQIGGSGVRRLLEGMLEENDDEDIVDFIEEALENLSFSEDMGAFDFMDIDIDEKEDPQKPGNDPVNPPDNKRRNSRKSK